MTETHPDPAVRKALSALPPAEASMAESALSWLIGEEGFGSATQHALQELLWYQLPRKWLTSADEHQSIARALGRVLASAGLARYAAICVSDATARILDVWDRDASQGFHAFRRAVDASGIEPPDLPDLVWGQTMGPDEFSARGASANALEDAIASGRVRPSARRARQDVVRAELDRPRDLLGGRTFRNAILTERMERWIGFADSPRHAVLAPVANRLLSPVGAPPGAADAFAHLRWLLEQCADGLMLTQAGYLPRTLVVEASERLRWIFDAKPRTEADFPDLQRLHEVVRAMGAVRKAKRRLTLTTAGRGMLADGDALFVGAARWLCGDESFRSACAEIMLALLLQDPEHEDVMAPIVLDCVSGAWRDKQSGGPPVLESVRHQVWDTVYTGQLLGLFETGGDWRSRTVALTDVGRAAAVEALRARATAPRRRPF